MCIEIVPDQDVADRSYTIVDLPDVRDPAGIQGEDALRAELKRVQDELIVRTALCADAQQQVRQLSRDVAALAIAWNQNRMEYVRAWFAKLHEMADELRQSGGRVQ